MRIFIFLTLFITATSSFAQSKDWGLGIIIANPTGFSVKHRMSSENSLDAALGYSFGNNDSLHIHSTYLWEFNDSIDLKNFAIGHYFGVGGAIYNRDKDDDPPPWAEDDRDEEWGVAVRGSAGLNHYFRDPSFEVFAEISLDFFFVPATDVDLGIAIGGRYFF